LKALMQNTLRAAIGLATAVALWMMPGAPAHAVDVTLAWDANTEPDLAGYIVYFGDRPRSYSGQVRVGHVTRYTVTGLPDAARCYFALKAFSDGGQLSEFSDEVAWDPPVAGAWGSSGAGGADRKPAAAAGSGVDAVPGGGSAAINPTSPSGAAGGAAASPPAGGDAADEDSVCADACSRMDVLTVDGTWIEIGLADCAAETEIEDAFPLPADELGAGTGPGSVAAFPHFAVEPVTVTIRTSLPGGKASLHLCAGNSLPPGARWALFDAAAGQWIYASEQPGAQAEPAFIPDIHDGGRWDRDGAADGVIRLSLGVPEVPAAGASMVAADPGGGASGGSCLIESARIGSSLPEKGLCGLLAGLLAAIRRPRAGWRPARKGPRA
jgi:hypothetical protein